MKNLTFRQLRVFVEVTRQMSFARAAESLHLTPPAVTMQVKELEDQVGLALFDARGPQGVADARRRVLPGLRAAPAVATLKEADDAMARFKRVGGRPAVDRLVSTAKYFVPQLLARFREEHPGVESPAVGVPSNREQLVAPAARQRGRSGGDGAPAQGTGRRAPNRLPRIRRCSSRRRVTRCCGVGQSAGAPTLAPYPLIVRERGFGHAQRDGSTSCASTTIAPPHRDGDVRATRPSSRR